MEDRSFLTNNHPTDGISDTFRQFIELLVEEVIINGEPFDAQKKWLRKHGEAEGVDHEALEKNMNDLFEAVKELEEHESKFVERSARALAKECYLSEALVNNLIDHATKVRTEATERATDELNGHDYVDLGLPSGTLWATCNIGATKPEEYGDYFAWGEISTNNTYNWNTYKYANGASNKLTKYCSKSDYGNNGFTDSLTELQRGDDPAAANWGSGWQTPSYEQWEELLENTTNEWTKQNGVKGRLFTSKKNGQTLFLPAAGDRWDNEPTFAGYCGRYWSMSLYTDDPSNAWYLHFHSYHCGMYISYYKNNGYRDSGRSVRPVRSACQN